MKLLIISHETPESKYTTSATSKKFIIIEMNVVDSSATSKKFLEEPHE
jgi:hypothetical protein